MYLPNILFFFINYQWLKIGLYALLLGGSYALWTLGLKLYGPVRCVPVVFMIYFHIYIISIFFNFIFLGLKLHGPVRCARGVIYDLFIIMCIYIEFTIIFIIIIIMIIMIIRISKINYSFLYFTLLFFLFLFKFYFLFYIIIIIIDLIISNYYFYRAILTTEYGELSMYYIVGLLAPSARRTLKSNKVCVKACAYACVYTRVFCVWV